MEHLIDFNENNYYRPSFLRRKGPPIINEKPIYLLSLYLFYKWHILLNIKDERHTILKIIKIMFLKNKKDALFPYNKSFYQNLKIKSLFFYLSHQLLNNKKATPLAIFTSKYIVNK